jgi:hypothetical protein
VMSLEAPLSALGVQRGIPRLPQLIGSGLPLSFAETEIG